MPSTETAQNNRNREYQLFVVSTNQHVLARAIQYQNPSGFLLAAAVWEGSKK